MSQHDSTQSIMQSLDALLSASKQSDEKEDMAQISYPNLSKSSNPAPTLSLLEQFLNTQSLDYTPIK